MIYIGFDSDCDIQRYEFEQKLKKSQENKLKIYNEKLKTYPEVWKRLHLESNWKKKLNYDISNHGKIRDHSTKKLISRHERRGYYRVALYVDGVRKHFTLHRLVCAHFCRIPDRHKNKGKRYSDLVVNHKNGIKTCNAAFNLEWVTHKENNDDARKNGYCDWCKGEKSHLANISEQGAKEIISKIMAKKNNATILEEMNNAGYSGVTLKTIQHIRSKECWKYLTKDLEFPKLAEDLKWTIPESKIREICVVLQQKKYSDTFIAKMFDMKREYVRDIRRYKLRKDISKDYDF